MTEVWIKLHVWKTSIEVSVPPVVSQLISLCISTKIQGFFLNLELYLAYASKPQKYKESNCQLPTKLMLCTIFIICNLNCYIFSDLLELIVF